MVTSFSNHTQPIFLLTVNFEVKKYLSFLCSLIVSMCLCTLCVQVMKCPLGSRKRDRANATDQKWKALKVSSEDVIIFPHNCLWLCFTNSIPDIVIWVLCGNTSWVYPASSFLPMLRKDNEKIWMWKYEYEYKTWCESLCEHNHQYCVGQSWLQANNPTI